jgi:hypothetical protein
MPAAVYKSLEDEEKGGTTVGEIELSEVSIAVPVVKHSTQPTEASCLRKSAKSAASKYSAFRNHIAGIRVYSHLVTIFVRVP